MHNKSLEKLEYYKILDILTTFCTTLIGKNIVNNLQPSNNKSIVLNSLNETTQANSLIYKKGNPVFYDICNIAIYKKTINSNGILSTKALLDIAKVLSLSNSLKNYFYLDNENCEELFPILFDMFSKLYTNNNLYEKITNNIIDEFTISDNATSNLLDIRRKQKNTEKLIKEKLNSLLHSSTYSKYIQDSVVTIRNNRYVIPVKEEYKSNIKGFIHDISSSGSTVFIEPISIFDLNNEISKLKADENTEIEKFLYELTCLMAPICEDLVNTCNLIGKLDFIFAKANYSISLNAIQPIINDSKHINLIKARHPLISNQNVVPISLTIGNGYRTLLITGPNTGGKTVTLKTIGILVLMACSGLHIPAAENSSIYIFDNIFADIGDEQSIQSSLSTFSAHISNIVEILNNSCENSLVLLDELGSGTDPVEGSCLAQSILETLYSKNLITIATTHYPELKHFALVTNGFENASVEFNIDTLSPTYRLLFGVPGQSNAFAISKKLGLNENIINRASSLIHSDSINIEELLKNIYDDKIAIENEKENIQKNSSQIELLKKSLDTKLTELKNKESTIIENAKIEARRILRFCKRRSKFGFKRN